MSTLKFDLNKDEFLMDVVTKKVFKVMKITMHTVWLRDESNPKDNNPDFTEQPKHMINRAYAKIDPKVVELLYKDAKKDADAIKSTFDGT